MVETVNKRLYLNWDTYIQDLEGLYKVLKDNLPSEVKYIYGIPRGGLIPATYLSYKLGLELATSLHISHPEYLGDVPEWRILVVDDLCDTGDTLKVHENYPTAVVYNKLRSHSHSPDWSYRDLEDNWIVFPYEDSELVEGREVAYYG